MMRHARGLLSMILRKLVDKVFKVPAHSNNEAEYATLDIGLQVCLQYGIQRLRIKGDAWKIKNPRLQ